MKDFLIIVFTLPHFIANEAEKIETILKNGVDYIHIRKPESYSDEMEKLIKEISPTLRNRLKLHDHFQLAEKYDLAGVQLNSRNPVCHNDNLKLSLSCHSFDEIEKYYKDMEYVTLSPIYDSISKIGYDSQFNIDNIKRNIADRNVIALGGVTPEKLDELKNAGFRGAAMLGCVWKDIDNFLNQLQIFKNK